MCEAEADWEALYRQMEVPELLTDYRCCNQESCLQHREALDAYVATWTVYHNALVWQDQLQNAGGGG